MSLAALLDKRITLQVLGLEQDEAGQPGAEGWKNVVIEGDGKVWAGIRDLSGRELIAAGAEESVVQTIITIRHRAGIAATMRALHGAHIYNIEAVLGQDGRRLQLMCSKVLA
ncbi:phage head closure protein [Rugamonas aquatica]|uniref:Phage head closure protein n=1 Tax=Rugamonas aquatica TaxID=2743357 RepID=A0A6A7N202_9BURK|nr:phage head closure protein [Rugamonas aquatica]MQA39032.1 phage head closure protein [Rugamonas aquatica]